MFVKHFSWYNSNMSVKMLNMGSEQVYSIELPFKNAEYEVAQLFKSFPTPNTHSNVTLQIDVPQSTLLIAKSAGKLVEKTTVWVQNLLCTQHHYIPGVMKTGSTL